VGKKFESGKKWVRSRKSIIWITTGDSKLQDKLYYRRDSTKKDSSTTYSKTKKIKDLWAGGGAAVSPLAHLQGPRRIAAGAEPPPATGASTVAAGLRPGSVPPARVRAERMPAAEAFVSAATSHPCALRLQAPPVPRLPRGITLLIPRALMRDFLNKILR